MAKKALKPTALQPQKFAVGETVRILRPHLWSGCAGEVVSFKDGKHRIRIEGKDGGFFHTDVESSLLESWI